MSPTHLPPDLAVLTKAFDSAKEDYAQHGSDFCAFQLEQACQAYLEARQRGGRPGFESQRAEAALVLTSSLAMMSHPLVLERVKKNLG